MASEPKQNDAKPFHAVAGCFGIGIFFLIIFVLIILFHPLGPALWFRWQADSASLEAAQDTAQLFLDAVRNEDGSSAYGLLSKDFRERLSAEERNSGKMNVAVAGGKRLTECKVGHGKLSHDEGLATIEGSVQTKDEQYPCRLVLVKEGRSWRVDLFTVQR